MEYAHWLIVAGAVLVVLGFMGFALHKNDAEPAEGHLTRDTSSETIQAALEKGRGRPRSEAEGEGEMIVRVLLLLAAISFSATAFPQSAPPKVGSKPLVQVKPKEPMGCKLVGMVKGTRLWAGDCVASELRGRHPRRKRNPYLNRISKPFHPARKSRAGVEGEAKILILVRPGVLS